MTHRLSLLIALALGTVPAIAATSASRGVFLHADDLHVALTGADTRPTDGMRPRGPGTSAQDATFLSIASSDLGDRAVRDAVADALDRGQPVLVRRSEPDGRREAEVFGFQGDGRVSMYRRAANGALDMITVSDGVSTDAAAQALASWMNRHRRKQPLQTPFSGAFQRLVAQDTVGGYTPILPLSTDNVFSDGRRIAHDIVVMRDVTSSRDEMVVVVKTQIEQAPGNNGLLWNGRFNVPGRPRAYHLFVPDSYRAETTLKVEGEPAELHIEDYQPRSAGAVERKVDESLSIKASKNVGANPDTLTSLAGENVRLLGKLPITVSSGTETTNTRSVSMNLKDYNTFVQPTRHQGSRGLAWAFSLAPDIANDSAYFLDGYNWAGEAWHSEARMTPMMRRATLETVSTWRIANDRGGKLVITTSAGVVNRVYDSLKRSSSTEPDIGESAISFTTTIDLDSPHLARQPSVRLASESGAGCLTQADPASPEITMQACERGEQGPGQQWNLEVDGTYRNRGSRQCLTADVDGGVRGGACGHDTLNQHWYWSADRVHSKVDNHRWRLHVHNGVPRAGFDPALHDDIRPNQHHALLEPWTQYPRKPQADFEIPQLITGRRATVYAEFLNYREVSADERWTPRLVRKQGY